ncbi:MAG TPA: hypothetical protein VFR58_17655, partial [Flavisolibacter sp.]|nr:hypothetical protein [Flavisolibacter sp.]
MRVLCLAWFTLVLLASCRTQKTMTNINYLENVRDTTGLEIAAMITPRIQKGDLLSIRVFSA